MVPIVGLLGQTGRPRGCIVRQMPTWRFRVPTTALPGRVYFFIPAPTLACVSEAERRVGLVTLMRKYLRQGGILIAWAAS